MEVDGKRRMVASAQDESDPGLRTDFPSASHEQCDQQNIITKTTRKGSNTMLADLVHEFMGIFIVSRTSPR